MNRPGAGGTIAAGIVAKAPPDGYTLLVHSSGHVVNPSIYKTLPYDVTKSFVDIAPFDENVDVVADAKAIVNELRKYQQDATARQFVADALKTDDQAQHPRQLLQSNQVCLQSQSSAHCQRAPPPNWDARL
ncbi:MAG: hypothetical protein EBY06_01120 [Burkholderiaceae bacterium]|nr:hypothetical protein [Burkholderiaceae bacterium]